MTRYEQFRRGKLSLSPFGIEKGESKSGYFCTPRGAVILGWTGVDGIHYCTLKSFGGMIFAVNPYADPKRHAFPVAEDFDTFLRLLAAVGDESALELAHAVSAEAFARYLAEHPMTDAQKSAADAIALPPMDDPHGYLTRLYDTFDFDAIPYKKDYYEWVPADAPKKPREWKIYFSTLGASGEKGERTGRELPLGAHISFAGYDWLLPAAYVCTHGIIVDMLAEVPVGRVREFYEKWGKIEDDGGFDMGIASFLTEDERLALASENPFGLTFSPILTVNGRPLQSRHSTGHQHIGDERLRFGGTSGMEEILAHYGLSAEKCWMLRRFAFPWATAAKPKLRSLGIRLRRKPVSLPGPHFFADGAGQQFRFVHPITQTGHTLTVQTYEAGKLTLPSGSGAKLPDRYAEMTVTISPEIPPEKLSIRDVRQNDTVRTRSFGSPHDASSVGIIGGADGPTALIFGKQRTAGHSAVSALTFEPQERVEWMLVFREIPAEEAEADLLS